MITHRPNTARTMMLAPAAITLTVLVGLPLIMLIVASFTDFNARSLFTGTFEPVGFRQYAALFSSGPFYHALGITILFTASLVVGSMLIGMGAAQLMTKLGPVPRTAMMVTLVMAWALPIVASSLIFRWMFQPGYGIAGTTLSALGLFGDVRDTAWLASAPTAFVVIWLLVVWQAVPYIAITTYAAQSQLDPSFAEAAALDGAGRLRTYWQVTVPLLAPHLGTICILSCIWDFNIFNQIWLLTQGGPDSQTATIGVYTYRQAFVGFRIGEGSAISVVTMVILFVLTLAYLRRLASEHDR